MSESLTKWRVTGPDGIVDLSFAAATEELALDQALTYMAENYVPPFCAALLKKLGYRAEPIEPEPKMVTVRAEDLAGLLDAWHLQTEWINTEMHTRLRAALEDAK